jgi:hypothetical protein
MLTKEQMTELFNRHITVYPIRYRCAIPYYPKPVKKKP